MDTPQVHLFLSTSLKDPSIHEWLSLNFEIQEHNKFGTMLLLLLLGMWSWTMGFHIWRKCFVS